MTSHQPLAVSHAEPQDTSTHIGTAKGTEVNNSALEDIKGNADLQSTDRDDQIKIRNHIEECLTEPRSSRTNSQEDHSVDRPPSCEFVPQVCWAQSESKIVLKIQLSQVGKFSIKFSESGNRLDFYAHVKDGNYTGEKLVDSGKNYRFSLNFYSNVNGKRYHCYRLKRYLLLELQKVGQQQQFKWPRLTCQPDHFDWLEHCGETSDGWDLMVDESDQQGAESSSDEEIIGGKQRFEELEKQLRQIVEQSKEKIDTRASDRKDIKAQDQVRTSHDDEDESQQQEQQHKSSFGAEKSTKVENLDKIFENNPAYYNPYLFNPFRKKTHQFRAGNKMKHDYRRDNATAETSKNTAKYAHDYRKTYLFIYNLILFILFLMVNMILLIKVSTKTIDDDSVRGAAFIIKLLTYIQLLETLHPILGLVPGGPSMPFLQSIGRLIVNEFLSDPKIRVDSAPYAHYLFIVWSSIEIFRYSFYALRVFKVDIYPLTWCRYTLFLPLYPMGGFCESQVISSTIKEYEKTTSYSVGLPNSANFSFNLPIFLRFYQIALLGPSIVYLMRYMWSQRCKQLKVKVS